MQSRQERVDERVQVLVPDRRKVHEPGAPVLLETVVDYVAAAVDGHLVPARGQP